MIKYDRNFCKPDEDMRPIYCPLPLAVVIHHHDEGDDPETGEHWESDWDEKRTEVFPTAEDKALMGYLPLSTDYPVDPAPDGQHYERTDRIEPNGDGYKWVYVLVDNPPPPPRVFDKYRLVDALMEAGVWEHVEAWLKETPNAWTRALMAPDISEDEPLLAQGIDAVKELLGWTDEQVEAILAASVREG